MPPPPPAYSTGETQHVEPADGGQSSMGVESSQQKDDSSSSRRSLTPNKGLIQQLVVEFLGTMFLGIAVVMAVNNDPNVLFTNAKVVSVLLVVFLYMFGPISGGHFNPAVTFAVWLSGKGPSDLNLCTAGLYLVAQIIGGMVGGSLAYGVDDDLCWSDNVNFPYINEQANRDTYELDKPVIERPSTPTPTTADEFNPTVVWDGKTAGEGFNIEWLMVFLLCTAYCMWGNNVRNKDTQFYAIAIGVTYIVGLLLSDDVINASVLNFALYLALVIPRVACQYWAELTNEDSQYFNNAFYTGQTEAPRQTEPGTLAPGIPGGVLVEPAEPEISNPGEQVWVFLIGDLLGALVAGLLFRFVLDPTEESDKEKRD